MAASRPLTVAVLGTTQTLSWASSYYIPAILAAPIAAEFGVSRATIFGVFSGALLLTAFLGPMAGRAIDRRGGRDVLAVSNIVFAVGLLMMGLSPGPVVFGLAWAVMGVAMAMGLYDAAFATLAGLYKTTDGAKSWKRIGEALADQMIVAMVVDRARRSTVYLAGRDGMDPRPRRAGRGPR